ncbi:MAG TPA: VWA domain-containing protein [Pyrinomonadaceae bacterium]|nr:VWA domain-containing protein [Pyrinomonadaceae bacterium]
MFCRNSAAPLSLCAPRFKSKILLAALPALLVFSGAFVTAAAQSIERELNATEHVTVSIKNRNGRVQITASDEQKNVSLKAASQGQMVAETDVVSVAKGNSIEIDVHARREQDRIDLTVRVPSRARVKVISEAGAVDVVGNLAFAEVETNTGTIRADVPVDAVRLNLLWQSSRPRFFSDIELPKVKEKRGGWFEISGTVGDKKAKKDARVELAFTTQRGVMLFNVDANMVPSDLRERPLTEAVRAIVRGGDSLLVDAIRKVSPRYFGDYARTLPPPKETPSLVQRPAPGVVSTPVGGQLMRLNVNVTDRHGRALAGLQAADFSIFENGQERPVTQVEPASAPFNLVLLLDVSGSVEEHINFIRKAARNFIATVGSQDRVAIISFRDDIQVISDFTTDHRLLSESLKDIDAGGATALYDALAYTLVEQLKQLRGERTAIVIMSDGDDNKSFVPFGAVLESVVESGALIYPLYVPSALIREQSVPTPEKTIDPLRSRFLTLTTRAEEEGRQLANVSGGVYYPITRLEELQRAYDDIVSQLRMSYKVTYASNTGGRERGGNNNSRGGGQRVRVRVNRDGASVRLSPAIDVAAP